jgi:hypothetical protein
MRDYRQPGSDAVVEEEAGGVAQVEKDYMEVVVVAPVGIIRQL